ncbi:MULTISPECIES: hypothetical protein [Pseudomonas]|uniref:Uncharacterized protein n=1 Tax=Pseudomonas luteola TaxID=47886 RepID=A0A2X2C4B8_PSELU|nr:MULTISPECIES: hypothetical protein [Pseudomonas]ENA32958.1 hypothetical protein HMPREF1487_06691 [Pseudomonas sp. HPB0071]MBF8639821.1 hypothetical protein [Pseudomonas zeshuii]RRW40850.1 hypothetical protein EGJ50_23925 [Pseudomonas luteola]SHI63977.1 hypothetical protein SAMN05216295_102623 [Pseudomonas zeshuii]SPZ01761.1 Uncharacterised protein [Pseudomonas luteola]
MIRIQGKIGTWPVDLTVELEAEDWTRLAEGLNHAQPVPSNTLVPVPKTHSDPLWESVLALVEQERRIEGPHLLSALEKLAGNVGSAKQLIVRLRHNPNIRIEKTDEAQVFVWAGTGQEPAPDGHQ